MKKFIFLLAFLVLPFSAYADGAFLNVDVVVSNDNGGTLKPSDFQYEIEYDNTIHLLTGPVQAFGFPDHVAGTPLTYSVTPFTMSSYSSKTSQSGCSGTITGNKMPLLNCTIYQTDTGYPLPVVASSPAVGEFGDGSYTPVVENTVTTISENEETIKVLQIQLISLLQQLIALKLELLLQLKSQMGL